MLASIIITTYRRPKLVRRAIQSCVSQDFVGDYEIIVVDDNGAGSDMQSKTEAVVKSFEDIHYISLSKNSGACIARNKGAAMAKGRYLFFLDDDDEFLFNKLQLQVSILEENQYLDACLSGLRRYNTSSKSYITATSNFPEVGDLKNFILRGNFFTPMLCIRKESFIKINGFDDIERFQDRYFMIKALMNNLKVLCLNTESYIMYEHSDDRISNRSPRKTLNALSQIKSLVLESKVDLAWQEFYDYELKDLRKKMIAYYNSKNVIESLYFIKYYILIYIKKQYFNPTKRKH
ncbi:glycosyltransferase family 2 protein [Soonwooa sp.]|uniref:glycosyltransferase family 2 protein n=1 Tax=Soonwooa sp. TaxID=1938592 RepID=UPI0035B02E04